MVKTFLEFFLLQSTLDSEFFRGGVFAPTFFGHAKYQVKNFLDFFVYRALWADFFRGAPGPIFFGLAKFNAENFSEFFCLQCTQDSEFLRGGVWHQLFLSCQI